MEKQEVERDTRGESYDAHPAPSDGGRINVGKTNEPQQLPTIGFAALKRKLEESGVRVDDLASKRSRKSRMLGVPKISSAHVRPVQAEPQETPDSPIDVSVELPMADATNMTGTHIEEPAVSATPALPTADPTNIDETYVEERSFSASPAPPLPDRTSIGETYEESPFSVPTAPSMAEAVIHETYVEEPFLSASPAPTAVEPPTPTTPVVPNPKPSRARPKKPVPPGPQIKRRPGRARKDTSGRVMILRNGVERVITSRDVRRLNTSVGSNARSSLPGFQNFKDSTDDCFFDLLTSVEAALLEDGAAPTGLLDQRGTGQPSSTMPPAEISQNVESQASGSGTQEISTPTSVVTAFKLLLPSLYRRSARNIPELYEVSQTFWVRKDEASAVTGDPEAPSASTDVPSEPTFFYWDPMPLATDPLLCPSNLCRKALERFGHAPAPRPVQAQTDDVEVAFWIIGARYQCIDCAAQVKGKGKPKAHSGYVGWDERIMAQLPASIRKEFPAVEMEKRFIVADNHRSLRQWAHPYPEKNQELVGLSRNWLDPDSTMVNEGIPEPDALQIPSNKPRSKGARSASHTPSLSDTAKQKRKRKCSKCLQVGCKGNRSVALCDNPCAGCNRFCCAEHHRAGRNLCMKPDRATPALPSLPNPEQPTDFGDGTLAEETAQSNKPVVNEEEEERSVEEALGLI